MDVNTLLFFSSFLLFHSVLQIQSQDVTHSLYYIYTALSKPVDLPGIYEFTAMGLLDDRQIDYYNNKEQRKIPKQQWMREKMPADYWEKGTQSRKSKEQWFNVNVNILIERMRHNNSDVHVLQWRHGCEVKEKGNEVTFSKGIDQYSYDGQDFLSFDDKESRWVAPVTEAKPTKDKWDNVPILNQYTKGYLEKECVDWLNKFREYGDAELKSSSPPDVRVFARKSTSKKNMLKLTCLATGFYPKDVTMFIRKYKTSLSDTGIESSGVRPNHDGTYQLRKSVEIVENEKADYDCYVAHSTLKEAVVQNWDGFCGNCNEGAALGTGVGIGVVIGVLAAALGLGIFLYKRKKTGKDTSEPRPDPNGANPQVALLPPVNQQVAVNIPDKGNAANAEEAALLNPSDSSTNSSQEDVNKSGGENKGNETGTDSGKGSTSGLENSTNSSLENMDKSG